MTTHKPVEWGGCGNVSTVDDVLTDPEELNDATCPLCQVSQTVYVVTWEPEAIGGFEWRKSKADAEQVMEEFAEHSTGLRLDEVKAPADLVGEELTAWLDENWYDR